MTTFTDWWDADKLTTTNPYREDSPMFWAWEGWVAGSVEIDRIASELQDTCHKQAQRIAELEACIKSNAIPVKTMTGGVAHYCTGGLRNGCMEPEASVMG